MAACLLWSPAGILRVRVCPAWEVECLSLAKAWKPKVGIGGFKPAAESY